ncbi:hypothetical protein RclHR1_03920013 [Rhizophagus clarus]|uniref:HMG box domain-containing protein n=1 Tax=Rhizophagus clarus TaxID=94130 RepID=A0A2Z6REZ8_9GLOM|nr:hypothetical protein RclHR1_03920013 [Rhizophagus clarus]
MKITNPEDIKVPFPPQIKAEDILEKRRQNRKSAKSPNAFFIYRIAYLDQIRLHNFRVKMTDMSGLVSASWKKEPSNVKATYKDLARKVERLVIEARQKALAQRSQPPEPVFLERQYSYDFVQNNNQIHNSFVGDHYFNNFMNSFCQQHQPIVPSQNFVNFNFENNNRLNNNYQFFPTLSPDDELPLINRLEQQPFNLCNNNDVNIENIFY